MTLTTTKCNNTKAEKRPRKLFDGEGLYLEVLPSGSKLWRLKYHYLGKEKRISLGAYPIVTLAEAREKRSEAKKLLAKGIDPAFAKEEKRRKMLIAAANTFETVAREWHEKQALRWTPNTSLKVMGYLENNIFPYIGGRPIASITPVELLEALRKIEKRGAYYIAGRIRQIADDTQFLFYQDE